MIPQRQVPSCPLCNGRLAFDRKADRVICMNCSISEADILASRRSGFTVPDAESLRQSCGEVSENPSPPSSNRRLPRIYREHPVGEFTMMDKYWASKWWGVDLWSEGGSEVE